MLDTFDVTPRLPVMPADATLDHRPAKPSRRLWLLAPYALIVLLLGGWSVGWFVVKGQVEGRLDQQAAYLRDGGWTVSMADRRVDGFPFRMRVRYGRAQLVTPSRWELSAPGLEAQAYLHKLDHWVVIAPRGLTFVRPEGGPVAVTGQGLRASLAGLRDPVWRVVLEGSKVAFAPSPDARPFALTSADLLQLYIQPTGRDREARWLLRLENGQAAQNALLSALARGKPVAGRAEGRLTRLDAWREASTVSAARGWTEAGGAVELDRAELDVGPVKARLVQSARLGFGADGRVNGRLPIEVRPAKATLGALAGLDVAPEAAGQAAAVLGGRSSGDAARLTVVFEAGATTLGPVRIGPSPKLF